MKWDCEMIIIIDGYNFIKSISAHKLVDDSIVQSWIVRFQRYFKLRQNKVILVFDAGPFFGQSKEVYGDVEVIYAGQLQTADDVLKIWLERNAELDVLLVTSDRQIRNHALNFGVVSISSQDFFKAFNLVMKEEEEVEYYFETKIHKLNHADEPLNQDLDFLMERASRNLVAHEPKNDYDKDARIKNSFKIKKSDRKVMKKIDKI